MGESTEHTPRPTKPYKINQIRDTHTPKIHHYSRYFDRNFFDRPPNMSSPETQPQTMTSTLLARAMLPHIRLGHTVLSHELHQAPAFTSCSPLPADPTVADQDKHHENHAIQCST